MARRSTTRVEVYRSQHGDSNTKQSWRWRVFKGSRIIHASTESYTKFSGCMKNLHSVFIGLTVLYGRPKLEFLDEPPKTKKANWKNPHWWNDRSGGMAQ